MARTHRWRWLAVAAAAAATAAAAAAYGNPLRSISRHIANAAVTSPSPAALQQTVKETNIEPPAAAVGGAGSGHGDAKETLTEVPDDDDGGESPSGDAGNSATEPPEEKPVAEKPTAVEATNDCLNAINALRKEVGTVEPALEQLRTDGPLEADAQGKVVKEISGEAKCVSAEELSKNNDNPGIIIEFDKSTPSQQAPSSPNNRKFGALSSRTGPGAGVASPIESSKECESLIRETYKKGLDALKASSFDPAKDLFNIQSAPFNSTDARNLASIMWANSKAVGCAVSTNCEKTAAPGKKSAATTHHVLYCKFDKNPSTDQKPFSLSLYNAMLGIKLPSSGFLATPTILLLISTSAAYFAM